MAETAGWAWGGGDAEGLGEAGVSAGTRTTLTEAGRTSLSSQQEAGQKGGREMQFVGCCPSILGQRTEGVALEARRQQTTSLPVLLKSSIWSPALLCAQSCPALCDPTDCSPPGPLSTGLSRQERWSGLPGPPPGELPDSGIKPTSLVSPALAGSFFIFAPPGRPSCALF